MERQNIANDWFVYGLTKVVNECHYDPVVFVVVATDGRHT